MDKQLARVLRQRLLILETASRYRASNVRVFGSVARGEDDEQSDIDFLVEFSPESTLLDQVALIEGLSALLGRNVDVISEHALNKYLREQVLRDAVPL